LVDPHELMNKATLEKTGFDHLSLDQFREEKIFLRDGREAVLCVDSDTGHGILDPEYWVEDDYYEETYREQFSAKSDGKKVDSEDHLAIFNDLNRKQFLQFKKYLNSQARALEIGCSFGGVMRQVAESGVAECHAIEPNKEDASFVEKLIPEIKLYSDSFDKVELPDEFYDLVISFEVLEHISSPRQFLEKTLQVLKRGGVVNFEVPNHKAALLRCYQNTGYDRFYYHKAHIHYFTSESLRQLFQICGFEGQAKSFSMYPFFNHVYWYFNRGPQASFKDALTTPQPSAEKSEVQQEINNFYNQVESSYEDLVNRHGVSDCLLYQGHKK
jgi:2-polyprenyl-3-methyl-5-hydroxy-6-metoxy-1,4-benzoquinol methylase